MSARAGVAIAVLSSALGGLAAVATRFVAHEIDPVTIASFRFGGGFLCLLPVALALRSRWPQRADFVGVAALGLMFFAFFFIVYNIALGHTTAARGTLALSTLPLLTMVVAAALRAEPLTVRKTSGVLIAMAGVAVALAAGIGNAPPGAWRGDLLMVGGTLCMAFYNVWSRPFIERSSALGYLAVGMGAGALTLILVGVITGRIAVLWSFGVPEWTAALYLGVGGGALAFILWVLALAKATPTRVANTMTVNPIAAALLARELVGEPITTNLVIGLMAVFAGIWIATQPSAAKRR